MANEGEEREAASGAALARGAKQLALGILVQAKKLAKSTRPAGSASSQVWILICEYRAAC
jgi:hypothetical protein